MLNFKWRYILYFILLLILSLILGALLASYLYSDIGKYKFSPLLWFGGFIHKTNVPALFISGLAGIGAAIVPLIAFVQYFFPKRKLHGEARFAKRTEISKAKLFKGGSDKLIIGKYGNKYLYYQGDLHPFLAAPTGSGKGVGYVIPNMLNWGGSVVLTDMKKEGWEYTSGYRKNVLNQECYYFDPLNDNKQTIQINPFTYIRVGTDHMVTDIRGIADTLITNEASGGDNDWALFAKKLFTSLTLLILEAGTLFDWNKSIGQVYKIINSNDDLAELIKKLIKIAEEKQTLSSECKGALLSFTRQPSKQREGTVGTLDGALQLWQSPLVDLATSNSDIMLDTLRKTPQSLYLVSTNDDLEKLRVLFKLIFQTIISVNTKKTPKEEPENSIPLTLLMDELLSLGKMSKLVHGLSYVRGYGIRIAPVLQSPSQLLSLYGQADTDSFLENTDVRIVYRPKQESAKKLSEMLGTTTVKQKSYSKSTGNPRTINTSEQSRALFLPQELRELPDNRSIVFVESLKPIYAHKIKYYEERFFKKRLLPAVPFPKSINTKRSSDVQIKEITDLSKPLLKQQQIEAIAEKLINRAINNS